MKILCLRAYANGYRGLLEERETYSFFQCTRQGRLTKLMTYDKAMFPNRRRFLTGMGKFMPRRFFFEKPVEVTTLTIAEMDGLCKQYCR